MTQGGRWRARSSRIMQHGCLKRARTGERPARRGSAAAARSTGPCTAAHRQAIAGSRRARHRPTTAMRTHWWKREVARPRSSAQAPGSSSRHSGMNSSRLWLAQPAMCSVQHQMKASTRPSAPHSSQNGSATAPKRARLVRRSASAAPIAEQQAREQPRPPAARRFRRFGRRGDAAAAAILASTSGRPSRVLHLAQARRPGASARRPLPSATAAGRHTAPGRCRSPATSTTRARPGAPIRCGRCCPRERTASCWRSAPPSARSSASRTRVEQLSVK